MNLVDNITADESIKDTETGVSIKGDFRCLLLFQNDTYIEIDSHSIQNVAKLDYIKINDTTFRKDKHGS